MDRSVCHRVFPRLGRLLLCLLLACSLRAHEGGKKDTRPTKAARDLRTAQKKLAVAKKKAAALGAYRCCVKPSCDLCARTTGTCDCGTNVAKGLGACGECYAGWRAGRGAVKGIDARSVALLPAEKQASPVHCPLPAERQEAADALLRAKRTLVAEKRFFCCIRGGCGQCAHEANCPCGTELARTLGGVCGDCLDGWRSGQGSFPGIAVSDVGLAVMDYPDMHVRGWNLMGSGQIFGVYSDQTGPRGRDKIFSPNWLMGEAMRRVGPGTFSLHTMLSLEPVTITGRRYPLLLQEGETAYKVPIVNGQHPHDFFMELAASYRIRVSERLSLKLYGGPRGEPALGPVAYPHRESASENPMATLSHHYQDSTHIASNVATAAVTYGPVTWEVSGFHGREPGENRWALNSGAIDSLASRITVNPTPRWSAQFSLGRINNRERTHPLRDSFRQTASVAYARPLADGRWVTTVIWGRNHDLPYTQTPNLQDFLNITGGFRPRHLVTVPTRIPGQIYNSYVAESTLRFGRNWIWGRAESVDKDSLLLFEETPLLLLVDEQRFTRVQAYTAGYERELPVPVSWMKLGAGGQVTAFIAPANLAPVYGDHPFGVQVFLRLRLGR